nr:zinc finger, CCHC-type [Tanacetum cinerariifolium]
MAEKDAFLVDYVEGGLCIDNTNAGIVRNATVDAIRIRAKWENDDYICKGHILNGMSDSLFDVYTNVKSAKELWDSLESKYIAEDSSKESLRAQDSDKGKGKEVGGPSVNMIEEGKNKYNKQNKGKGSKDHSQDQGQNLVPVWNSFVKYSVSLLSEAFYVQDDAIAWWIDSGATTHVCKDRFPGDSDYVYMSSSFAVVNSSLWHARLGHVHYKRMLEMSKDDLIPAINKNPGKCTTCITHETTAPYTPQQKGVAERKNRALREMVNSMLSYLGLSEGFWGEAIPKDIIPNSGESQRDDHSDDVPSEITEPRKEAIDDEIGSTMENNICVLSDLPPSCKPLGCIWIFKRKMKVDGTIDKFKARLVIQGFRQKEGIDYFDTYALVARITTIRLLLALAAIHNLVIHQMDVKTTFLNGDLEKEVYMKKLEGFVMPVLEAYSDASWTNHVEDSSSTSGWVFMLGGGVTSSDISIGNCEWRAKDMSSLQKDIGTKEARSSLHKDVRTRNVKFMDFSHEGTQIKDVISDLKLEGLLYVSPYEQTRSTLREF